MSKNEHTWDMRYEGSKVINEAKLNDDRMELAGKVYNKMEEARKTQDELHYWYHNGELTYLRDMHTGLIHKRIRALADGLGDKYSENTDEFKLDWIGRFTRELERRREEAAAKSRIDAVTVKMYNPVNTTTWVKF